MQRESAVIQLPSELCRMRDADRLIERWSDIQRSLAGEEKLVALFAWQDDVEMHEKMFLRSTK